MPDASPLEPAKRQLRLIAILAGASRAGLTPLPASELHAIAYFVDALAPVWGLRLLEARLLKNPDGPHSPALQADCDMLVGKGLIDVSGVGYRRDAAGKWRLRARYELNPVFAEPVLERARTLSIAVADIAYVQEVVYAVSALGDGVAAASLFDASYGDEMLDIGSMLDIGTSAGVNRTARVAERFGELMETEVVLTEAEKLNLYVDELGGRSNRAA